jgi:hypothetical protein
MIVTLKKIEALCLHTGAGPSSRRLRLRAGLHRLWSLAYQIFPSHRSR